MGMDLYIYRARTKKVFDFNEWYNSEEITQIFYARKWWSLVENCSFIPKDYENGDYIELTKEDLEEMIAVACHNRDYFDSYKNVPMLCELRDKIDEDESLGYHYYFTYNY